MILSCVLHLMSLYPKVYYISVTVYCPHVSVDVKDSQIWVIMNQLLLSMVQICGYNQQRIQDFPVGGGGRGSLTSRRFLVKMYAKTK